MSRERDHRNKWANTLTAITFCIVLLSFSFHKGFINFSSPVVQNSPSASLETANVVDASKVPSPIENSKQTINAAFDEIKNQYSNILENLSSVLVPFISNIDVYEQK